jgi:hypothetical protein
MALLPAPGAKAASPAWSVESTASPSHLIPGDNTGADYYSVVLTNSGGAATDGSPITITDTLPPGVFLDSNPPLSHAMDFKAVDDFGSQFPCKPGPPVTCVVTEALYPGQGVVLFLPVNVAAGAPSLVTNHVTVSGGGLPDASTSETTPVSLTPAGAGVQRLGFTITDSTGGPVIHAGSHPYRLDVDFQLNTTYLTESGVSAPVASPRDLTTLLPPGLVVNPTATPVRCSEAQLETDSCPDASQVGLVRPKVGVSGLPDPASVSQLYNMQPPPGRIAAFGFDAGHFGIFIHLLGGLDAAGGYALSSEARDLPQVKNISGMSLEFWGDPSDPSHDRRRGACGEASGGSCPVPDVDAPFLTMPSACSDRLDARIDIVHWQATFGPISALTAAADSEGDPMPVTGCGALAFKPTLEARPTTDVADSPSGFSAELRVPQTQGQGELATANLRDVVLTLPEGLVVDASAANGLDACASAQFAADDPNCPDASKIGTAEIQTPLLDDPLLGSVYVASPRDNPFAGPLAIYVLIDDPATGVVLKLAGRVEPDPRTGRLVITFENAPQLPISDFRLELKPGPHAPLRTPALCGAYSTSSSLTPWSAPQSGPPATPHDDYSIARGPAGPCAGSAADLPHSPSFDAGTVDPIAGVGSSFVLHLARDDGSQQLGSIDVAAPPGLAATLADVGTCDEVELSAASCPANSRIGGVTIGAGAGPLPLYLGGSVYRAGPYKGAPLSLAIVVPAASGPFDFGDILVRVAVFVDPKTAQLSLVSDPFPIIVSGIPVDLRQLDLVLDRPGVIRNPTSCDPFRIRAIITSVSGADAVVDERFQVADCGALTFKPRVTVRALGGLERNGHPSLRAVLRMDPEGAGIASVGFTLPPGELLDVHHLGAICDRRLAPERCPAGSRLGRIRLFTPLLDEPLSGPVYLRTPSDRLPDLLADLHAGPVHIILRGHTSTADGLRVAFRNLPDVPLSRAVFALDGGRHGILANTESLCGRRSRRGRATFIAQNGATRRLRPRVSAGCG